jgi:Spy/CpxP family protein refolding chaperone
MKINKLSVIAGLALGSLVATGNMAIAQDQKGGGQRRGPSVEQRMEKMTEDLKLTDEQKPKVKAILEETQKKREELSGVPREERREKVRGIVEKENKKLKEVLTADQYTKREKMQEELRSSAKGGKNRKNGQDGQEKKE